MMAAARSYPLASRPPRHGLVTPAVCLVSLPRAQVPAARPCQCRQRIALLSQYTQHALLSTSPQEPQQTARGPPADRHHGRRAVQVLRAVPQEQVRPPTAAGRPPGTNKHSVGSALTDTLDTLITERRIEPQLAMRILTNFDKAVADVLADKVKARLTFKVGALPHPSTPIADRCRDISIPTDSVTTCGPSSSRTSTSSWITTSKFMPTASKSSAATQSDLAKPSAWR